MPVIVTCSTKGGVGKSTTALLMAQVLAAAGSRVTVVDADPNQPIARWASRTEKMPENLRVIPKVNEQNVLDVIDETAAQDPFVIVDLEGSANLTTTYAISRADLVIIPMKGKQLDADEAAKIVSLLEREGKAFRRQIPYRVMFSMTTALRSKEMRHIEKMLRESGIPMLGTAMAERAAFSAIFQLGGSIYDLTADDVANPHTAIVNAEAVTDDIVEQLRSTIVSQLGAEKKVKAA
ncbi:ParA family protein [Brucella sp. HL-2]|nr:ParA family protein [Brucella sp. HL-2]MCV9910175.1 ParA family protein [Brucella sp. HL-2]